MESIKTLLNEKKTSQFRYCKKCELYWISGECGTEECPHYLIKSTLKFVDVEFNTNLLKYGKSITEITSDINDINIKINKMSDQIGQINSKLKNKTNEKTDKETLKIKDKTEKGTPKVKKIKK